MLGKHWSYMTPEYLYYEMEIKDVSNCMCLFSKEEADWCFDEKWRGQDLKFIEKHKLGRIIKNNG